MRVGEKKALVDTDAVDDNDTRGLGDKEVMFIVIVAMAVLDRVAFTEEEMRGVVVIDRESRLDNDCVDVVVDDLREDVVCDALAVIFEFDDEDIVTEFVRVTLKFVADGVDVAIVDTT